LILLGECDYLIGGQSQVEELLIEFVVLQGGTTGMLLSVLEGVDSIIGLDHVLLWRLESGSDSFIS
jgi:hypothetical protein